MTIPRTEKLHPGKAANLDTTSLFYHIEDQSNEPMQLYNNLKKEEAFPGTKSGRSGNHMVAYN